MAVPEEKSELADFIYPSVAEAWPFFYVQQDE